MEGKIIQPEVLNLFGPTIIGNNNRMMGVNKCDENFLPGKDYWFINIIIAIIVCANKQVGTLLSHLEFMDLIVDSLYMETWILTVGC